jgi:hypothetical protein
MDKTTKLLCRRAHMLPAPMLWPGPAAPRPPSLERCRRRRAIRAGRGGEDVRHRTNLDLRGHEQIAERPAGGHNRELVQQVVERRLIDGGVVAASASPSRAASAGLSTIAS